VELIMLLVVGVIGRMYLIRVGFKADRLYDSLRQQVTEGLLTQLLC